MNNMVIFHDVNVQQRLQLAPRRPGHLIAEAISYSGIISACGEATQWEQALQFIQLARLVRRNKGETKGTYCSSLMLLHVAYLLDYVRLQKIRSTSKMISTDNKSTFFSAVLRGTSEELIS